MAKKYIDAEAAFNEIFKLPPKVDDDGYCWVTRAAVAKRIDSIPAADVVEVVRCRDCTYNYGTEAKPRCDFLDYPLAPYSFCSCGFRKTEDNDG